MTRAWQTMKGTGLGTIAFAAVTVATVLAAAPAVRPFDAADRAGGDGADGIAVSIRHRDIADCLWPAARDHGFYAVQKAALEGERAERYALWVDFARSIGAERCGVRSDDLAPLRQALADTGEAADRHFMATR